MLLCCIGDYIDFYIFIYYVIVVGSLFCFDNLFLFNYKWVLIGYYGCLLLIDVLG